MQIISVINQKGGVGKTTTVINLAAGLSKLKKKILVIDLDPQGNATTGLGLSNVDNSSDTIYGVLNGSKEITQVIKKTQFDNLDIITSNVDLSGLEVETADDSNRAFILKAKLASYLNNSGGSYDYVLIDCPPSLSLLTVIPRNVRLSEAPSHGMPVLIYDKSCPGSKSYFSFTDEFLNQESTIGSAA